MRTPVAAAIAALVLAVGLTGCSVSVVGGEEPAPQESTPTVDATTDADQQASDETERPAPEEKPDGDASLSAEGQQLRDEAIAAATTRMACADRLSIDQVGAVILLEGPCGEVTITASAAVVILDDVETLRISGTGNVVHALDIGSLELTGDVNEVAWAGPTPRVDDHGTANVSARG